MLQKCFIFTILLYIYEYFRIFHVNVMFIRNWFKEKLIKIIYQFIFVSFGYFMLQRWQTTVLSTCWWAEDVADHVVWTPIRSIAKRVANPSPDYPYEFRLPYSQKEQNTYVTLRHFPSRDTKIWVVSRFSL